MRGPGASGTGDGGAAFRTAHRAPDEGFSGTVIEAEEEIREALRASLRPSQEASPPAAVPPSPPPTRPVSSAPAAPVVASPFRPTIRPPIAVLTVQDDGRDEGEVIRIRSPRFVIGRTEGDLRIPIDGRISARHVEITLQTVGGSHRWVVTDLQSTHGMFVRVSRTPLVDGAEFLVGNGRYQFQAPQNPAAATAEFPSPDAPRTFDETRGWADEPGPIRAPALTELLGNDIGNRILLIKPEYWIGSDPACPICRPDDPFCEPRHVRLHRNVQGKWNAEHPKTHNGLWLRMPQIVVSPIVQFQIGEQRFKLKVQ